MANATQEYREMNAIYAGKCKFCGQTIAANDPILYYPNQRKIAHDRSYKCKAYKESLAKTAAFTEMIMKQEQQARQNRANTQFAQQKKAEPVAPVIRDGFYTVVHEGTDGERTHKTYRVFTGKPGKFAEGRQMVAIFLGRENTDERAYKAFAFVNGAELSVWKRCALYTDQIADAKYLLDPEHAEAAGIAYSLESNNCRRCGRLLTNPASIENTIGPECAKKW